jgi:hypothetical protein
MAQKPEGKKAKPRTKTGPKKAGPRAGACPKDRNAKTAKTRAKVEKKGKKPSAPADSPDPKKRVGAGRPPDTPNVWTPEHKVEVVKLIEDYLTRASYPSVAEFCYKYRIRKQRLYEFEELAEARELLLAKKEMRLEEMGRALTQSHGGRATFVIFALKQLGWTDKQEIDANLHNDEGLTLILNGAKPPEPKP